MSAKLTAIALSIAILALAIILRRTTRSWTHPSVVFAAFWSGMTLLPLIMLPTVPINPAGTAYLFVCAVAFALPCFSFRAPEPTRSPVTAPSNTTAHNILTLLFIALQMIALACILANIFIQGFNARDLFLTPIETANKFMVFRALGQLKYNIFSPIGIVLNYTAVGLSGLIVGNQPGKFKKLGIFALTFAPSALHMIVYADKGTLFLSVALFFGGILAARARIGDTSLITTQTLKIALSSLILLLPLLVLSMLARGVGEWPKEKVPEKILFYISSYAFGHLYAFSDWLSHRLFQQSSISYSDPETLTFGRYTFMFITKVIDPSFAVPNGYFSEYYSYAPLLKSNIYTMYRGLIYDYGLVGALVFMSAIGLLSSIAYYRMQTRAEAPISTPYYIFLVGFIYSSFALSLLTWASVVASFVLLCGILIAIPVVSSPQARAEGSTARKCY